MQNWENKIFNIKTEKDFNNLSIQAFNYQFENVPVYTRFCKELNIKPTEITHYSQIPFLPIDFFKTHKIIAHNKTPQTTFMSSGTTNSNKSKHLITSTKLYEESFKKGFNYFYGDIENYCILALLPNYLEQGNSSLVYMAKWLIEQSKHPNSGFYLNNYNELFSKLKELNKTNQKVILLGVSYALLDFVEMYSIKLKNTIVIETGGMKGRRKEMIREELHNKISKPLGLKNINSEYGMTELLSQAYSLGDGVFKTPAWMKIIVRDTYDPFSKQEKKQTGGINIIDLANIYSCCFIETKDLGKKLDNNTFTILGRFDNSDIRGCNLMV